MFWRKYVAREFTATQSQGRSVIFITDFHGLEGHVMRECLTQLFRHLREMERTDGNSTSLLDWLGQLYERSRSSPGYSGLLHFEALCKIMSPEALGTHHKLFGQLRSFYVKNCALLFRLMGIELILRYLFALDRMRQGMSEVLASTLAYIGPSGRRQLHYQKANRASVYQQLSARAKRALRKMDEAKQHREEADGPLVPYQGQAGPRHHQLLGVRPASNVGVIPRRRQSELRRRFGRRITFSELAPSSFVNYIIVPRSKRSPHRPLPLMRPRHWRSSHRELEVTSLGSEFTDDDDMSSTTSFTDGDYSSNYELGRRSDYMLQHHDHGGHVPRRVSYGALDDTPYRGYGYDEDEHWDDQSQFGYSSSYPDEIYYDPGRRRSH
ncbi:MAG: hypothetical protein M1826_002911 [Phylliscum demangeonii]|nr:MAG: hypothetical protein M1826_002911 [Phylliscum demangeonii]